MKTTELMMQLIRSEFPYGNKAPALNSVSDGEIEDIYPLSEKHDLAHIVGAAAIRLGFLKQNEAKLAFNKKKLLAVFRREQLNSEQAKIYKVLEDSGIDYIPLKGAVIKDYFPEEWMRTSCDIDILIKESELEKAISAITENLGYEDMGRSFHDHSLKSKNGVHLELHFSLAENDDKLDHILESVWDFAESVSNSHRHKLTNEFLMFHIIAHTQYHFSAGGCGIKPFIDLWVLEHELNFSKDKLLLLLKKSGSERFYACCKELISVWFEEGKHSSLTERMEQYILSGGAFGTMENRISAKGGKFKYILSRIFLTKKELKSYFPEAEKKEWLLPFYQIKRWFLIITKRDVVIPKQENDVNSISQMFRELGL